MIDTEMVGTMNVPKSLKIYVQRRIDDIALHECQVESFLNFITKCAIVGLCKIIS